jgi:methionyl-tRNA synthetase
MKKTFYITTPIYYPNDIPHLGHAYTNIAADILARWNKLQGKDVYFLTGTDEHTKKVMKAAEKAGKTPKEFIDDVVPEFKKAWKKLNIEYNRFIRTTDPDHEALVKDVLQKVYDKGDIYLGEYEGFYCVDCEAYYTEKDAPENICPTHKTKLDHLKEPTYFFKLSKYQKFLLDHYEKNPEFISPSNRRKEIVNRVKEELRDLSISRTSFDWGIPFPFDKEHVTYVWFDALFNYVTPTLQKENKKFWPADLHIIGKDIIWFHTVYWPAMLKAAGYPLPERIFAHGWWTVHNEKMGKSAGNAIKIDELISYAGSDTARYFLTRETPFGEDGDFSEEALKDRHNNELADKLGNLVSRVSTLIEKYGFENPKQSNLESTATIKNVEKLLDNYELDKALNEIFAFIDLTNAYLQTHKPWETKDKKILGEAANAIKDATILLSPFIPEAAEKIAKAFHFDLDKTSLEKKLDPKTKIKKAPILFQKIQ